MSLFNEIIQQQVDNKQHYVRSVSPPSGGICIIIKNNEIYNIVDGCGWVHPTRKMQYSSLITNVINKYVLKDCNININLSDHSKSGCFNFCRLKNNNTQFLLPNHRFTKDDICIDNNEMKYDNFNQQKSYIFDRKIIVKKNKIFTSCIPHRSKVDYFSYALKNNDICEGYCYTGSTHKLMHLTNDMYNNLKEKGMAGEKYSHWINHLNYKYVLYNDGNTLSDRLRLLLTSNAVIIRPSGSPYEEFYSYLLKHNQNYVEYSNINELRSIHNELESNSKLYDKIIENNVGFVNKYLDYEQILLYTYSIINQIGVAME